MNKLNGNKGNIGGNAGDKNIRSSFIKNTYRFTSAIIGRNPH